MTQSFPFNVPLTSASFTGRMTGTIAITPRVPGPTDPGPGPVPPSGSTLVSPYYFTDGGNQLDAAAYMRATGVKHFTVAFILSDAKGQPTFNGRALTGGKDQKLIEAIRGAGGDVTVSVGGWSGAKLGEVCKSVDQLASAYGRVVDAFNLSSIDFDVEASEIDDQTSRSRVVQALALLRASRPSLQIIVTVGASTSGPAASAKAMMMEMGKQGSAVVDNWTIMPFNFGGKSTAMGQATVTATEGLVKTLQDVFGYPKSVAYQHAGISSMNGTTDVGESVSTTDFGTFVAYARQAGLGRLSNWSVNRDADGTFTRVLVGK